MTGFKSIRQNISLSIILASISVIGFIVLMASWATNFIDSQKHRIFTDIHRAATEVSMQLARSQNTSGPLLKMPSPGLSMPDFYGIAPQALVSDRYTAKDVDDLLHKAMARHDVKDFHVEFAVIYGSGLEMASPNFTSIYLLDSSSNPLTLVPISLSESQYSISNNVEYLNVMIPNFNRQVLRSLWLILAATFLFAFVLIGALVFTVRTMLVQRRLNQIKTDFINNMTHELKTPLATISLAVDALHNPKVQGNMEKSNYFSGIVRDEAQRMSKHVETILQAGLMEKQELNIKFEPIHINEIITQVADKFTLQLQDRNGKIILQLHAAQDTINGDATHFPNLVNNLIDNAIKYAKEDIPPSIRIATADIGKNLQITVADNGIGMNKETVKRIFEKFYRAHTGNVHNVKGFGLGMSYVKSVVSLHKGRIKVDSDLGKGSVFTLEFPLMLPSEGV